MITLSWLVTSCATTKHRGIDEYKELTQKGRASLQAALNSLEQISTTPGRVPSKLIGDYERNVQSLDVNSIKIRARAGAIRARGDAWFVSFSNSITQIEDPRVREAAANHRPELEAAFARLKEASHRAGAAFDPCLSGLKKLRVELETKPDAIIGVADRDLILQTSENGREALRQLAAIDAELMTMKKLLSPR